MTVQKSKVNEGQNNPSLFNKAVTIDEIRSYLGTTLSPKKYKDVSNPTFIQKVVAVGDLHGNPHPVLLQMLLKENPDLIIIGGDVFDLAKFSVHSKEYENDIEEFETEFKRIVAYFEILLEHTHARIIIIRGNHDNRIWKQLTEIIPDDLMRFVKIEDPLELLISTLKSDRVSTYIHSFNSHHPNLESSELGKSAYILPLGDAVISHLNFTGSQPGLAVGKLQKWLEEWHLVLGIPESRLLVQFHAHRWSFQFKKGGFLALVEPGMAGLQVVEGYKVGYNSKWNPGTLGFLVFNQEQKSGQWATMLETVRPVMP